MDPHEYEAWYHSPRGRWISDQEFHLLIKLLQPQTGNTLLDVGCGTGHFSRRFSQTGLKVTGLDPDNSMLAFAAGQGGDIDYLLGNALQLPFADGTFDYVSAITSLCFIADPLKAIQEMWRVTRKSIVIGLLNRHSLLYLNKRNNGSYRGARWDTYHNVKAWLTTLAPESVQHRSGSVLVTAANNTLQRWLERFYPDNFHIGAFMAIAVDKQTVEKKT